MRAETDAILLTRLSCRGGDGCPPSKISEGSLLESVSSFAVSSFVCYFQMAVIGDRSKVLSDTPSLSAVNRGVS
jgi:hypothetical protein